jgi:hypothetical protein
MGPLVAAAPAAASAAAPYVVAGISALSGAGGAAATGAQNRKSRAFSREMYQQQKTDNIAFWDMQNDYNSPERQMQRLKNAGLNPNMLYDKTGAVIPAGNINTPDVQGGQFRTPDFGSVGTGLVQGYFDTKIKQAQYDNLKAANNVSLQEAALKAAQTAGEVSRTEGQGINNMFASKNMRNALQAVELGNTQTAANTQFTLDSNTRQNLMNGMSLKVAAQDLLLKKEQTANTIQERQNARQMLQNLRTDNELKKVELSMRKMGINPTDPTWLRVATQALQPYLGLSGQDIFYNSKQWLRNKTGLSMFGKPGAGGSW